MNILIAPNAFKGTLTAPQAARAILTAMRQKLPHARFTLSPVADGGDGFAQVLAQHLNARWIRRRVHGPTGEKIWASFALSANGKTAIIELARASGLALLQRPSPMLASTRGTGELIAAALDLGAQRLLLGIGGSASTDGGLGLARSLGGRFVDKNGAPVVEGGVGTGLLERIDITQVVRRLRGISLEVACDVSNPLHGRRGAAHTFAPQKGAAPAQVRQLDAGLKNLARVIHRDLGLNVQAIPGAGAAGGTGAGLAAFCGARLVSGFDLVAQVLQLKTLIEKSDLVITGEGRLDRTTLNHKAPAGVLQLAREAGVPTIAICGSLAPGADKIGFDAIFDAKNPRHTLSAAAALAGAATRAGEWALRGNFS